MKNQLEIINTTFEKVTSKTDKANFWSFLTTAFSTLIAFLFLIFFMLFLTPWGLLSIVVMALIYRFIIF